MNGNKVILISIDGMRPDGIEACGHPYLEEMKRMATYTMDAQTIVPPVTLPAHMSLFHSVPAERHGVVTNTYVPMARPLDGLFEVLKRGGAICSFYTGWEPLRDVARPASVKFSEYINAYMEESSDTSLTESALSRIERSKPDFVFLHMVETDEKGGHDNGWMSDAYLGRIRIAIDNVKKVVEACKDEYTIIVTADHGGHERTHGLDIPEDRIIPNFFIGKEFTCGRKLSGGSILDIAPTIAKIMGVECPREWEGTSII